MQGVYTALITPFDESGRICEKTLVEALHRQHQSGIDCVVLLGTTGEPATVEDYERDLLVKVAVRELKGKIPIMVGCGTPCTKKTIEMVKKAEALGADAIQIITPYVNKPTQEGLYLHFEAISRATHLPICVYNIPGRCMVNLEVATVAKIAEIPNVVGIKECSGNFQQMGEIIERICSKKENFSLFSGDDPATLPMMAIGATGIMSVISNLIPAEMVEFVKTIQSGKMHEAKDMHYALQSLLYAVSLETNPIPIKYLMKLKGFDSGIVRLPLTPPSSVNQQKLETIYKAYSYDPKPALR